MIGAPHPHNIHISPLHTCKCLLAPSTEASGQRVQPQDAWSQSPVAAVGESPGLGLGYDKDNSPMIRTTHPLHRHSRSLPYIYIVFQNHPLWLGVIRMQPQPNI
jgi:hypothetical protein